MSEEKNNLRIWERAQPTDPKYTKNFSRAGGFRGTATNPTYLAKRATEVFGPIGLGWGYEIDREEFREGSPGTVIHILLLRFWYIVGDKRGEFTQFGQTTFVGQNKHGAFTDEEAPKKTLTDALTKCLSLLGFASDIHMGMYEDSKYVNNIGQQFRVEEGRKNSRQENAEQHQPRTEVSKSQAAKIWAMASEIWRGEGKDYIRDQLGITCDSLGLPQSTRDMTAQQASKLIERLAKLEGGEE